MKKSDLISDIAEALGEKRPTVEKIIDRFTDGILTAVARGERVLIPGFGAFKPKDRPEGTGKNPQTGATITIPAKRILKFAPATAADDFLNNGD